VLSVGAVATIAGRVRVPTPAALVEAYRFCFPAWPTNIPPVGFPVASVAGVGNTRNRVVALFESILFDVAKPAGTKPANERIGPENVVIAILNSSHASDGVLCLHVVSRDCQKHRMIPGMRSVYNTSLGAVQIKKARRLGRAKSLGVIQLNVALNLRQKKGGRSPQSKHLLLIKRRVSRRCPVDQIRRSCISHEPYSGCCLCQSLHPC
jgi:hypothetical protein